MDTLSRMKEEMKSALRAGDSQRLSALRFLLAQLASRAKDKQGEGKDPVLSEEEITDILRKEAKKRRESIDMYEKGDRADLAGNEKAELSVIQEFIPAELTREQIEEIVDGVIAAGASDFPSAIKQAMAALKGRADGKVVTEIVKAKLQ